MGFLDTGAVYDITPTQVLLRSMTTKLPIVARSFARNAKARFFSFHDKTQESPHKVLYEA